MKAQRTDDERFALAIAAMFETFGKELTPAQLTGYEMGLEGLQVGDVEKAVATALKTKRYLPMPAELRELAGDVPTATRAILAWGAVKKAVHAVTSYGSVDFDDPVVNATIRNMGGWARLCGSDADEFDTWCRKEFERIYMQLNATGISEDMGRPLKGLHDEKPTPIKTGLPPLERKKLGPS